MVELRRDGTAECPVCHLPMFPVAAGDDRITLECANRHRETAPVPQDAKVRRLVRSWVARKGAQLHVQHERWEGPDDDEDG